MILIEDDGKEEEDEGRNLEMAEMAEMAETQEIEIEDPMAGITLQSIPGFTKPKTMKLEGEMAGAKLIILIDSGASNNFISTSTARKLGLEIAKCKQFGVTLGTETEVFGDGICRRLSLWVQGMEICDNFFALKLGSLDVILGVQWLEKLGNVVVIWKNQTMTFNWECRNVILKGDPALRCSKISLKKLTKVLKQEKRGILIECNGIQETGDHGTPIIPSFLLNEVAKYPQVLQPITTLPPHRPQDHAITLQEGSNPVSLRPYRYPYLQKKEIEIMVQDMLKVGIIQPSTSPFASPVILVKKGDGSWRFCVDYRALNKATIPNKFPIPVIDELLDELKGATILPSLISNRAITKSV